MVDISPEALAVPAVLLIGTASVMARGIAGIGAGMILQLGWMLAGTCGIVSGNMKDAAGLTIAFDCAGPVMLWTMRRDLNWMLLLLAGVPWACCEVVGTAVLITQNQSPWLRRSFGIVLLGVLIWDVLLADRLARRSSFSGPVSAPAPKIIGAKDEEAKEPDEDSGEKDAFAAPNGSEEAALAAPDENSSEKDALATPALAAPCDRFDVFLKRNLALTLFLGIGGGVLKGIYSVPLPILTLFFFCSGIQKDEWRATILAIQLVALPGKAYFFFVVESQFEAKHAAEYVAIFVAAVAGAPLATRLGRALDYKDFKDFVRVVVATGSASNVLNGTPAMLVASLTTLALSSFLSLRSCRSRRVCGVKDPGCNIVAAAGGGNGCRPSETEAPKLY